MRAVPCFCVVFRFNLRERLVRETHLINSTRGKIINEKKKDEN